MDQGARKKQLDIFVDCGIWSQGAGIWGPERWTLDMIDDYEL